MLSRSRRCIHNCPGTQPPSPKWVMKEFGIVMYLKWCMPVLQDWASNSVSIQDQVQWDSWEFLPETVTARTGVQCTLLASQCTAGRSFRKASHFKVQFQLASYLHKGLPVPVWKLVVSCHEIPLNCCGAFYQLLVSTVFMLYFHPCFKCWGLTIMLCLKHVLCGCDLLLYSCQTSIYLLLWILL